MTPEEWDAMTDEEQAEDLRQALARIPEEIADETRRSRFRDRCSRRRKHPINNDVSKLLDFIINRRRHSAFAAARVVLGMEDGDKLQAFRLLVAVTLAPGIRGGGCGWFMRRRCERILGYADTIESALAQRNRFRDSESGIM